MVEPRPDYRSYDPDFDAYDDQPAEHHVQPYRFGQSARANQRQRNSVPLFLSDADGEPHPSEYIAPLRRKRASISARILAGVLAAAAAAILVALFSSDAMHSIVVNAKASIAAVLPAPSEAAQPDSTRLTARDVQLKDPTRLSGPANQTPGVQNVALATATPSRAEITNAYQSALQGRTPATVALAAPLAAPPAAKKIDADELATLMSRAKGLLAAGDIPPARLLLERAADAQEPNAALTLAQTYDPDVLGTQDSRNIVADPEAARAWYQRAAQLGSVDAQRRLSQLQN